MARTYRRDARGRFASGGGSGGKGGSGKGGGGKAKPSSKAKPKATSKPAASKGKGKAKPAATKPSPAAKGSRKPAASKPKATATRKPAPPPPIPDNLLRAAQSARAGAQARRQAGPANNIRRTNFRLADDDTRSDRRWAKRENAKANREIRQLEKQKQSAMAELAKLQAKQKTPGSVAEARKRLDASRKRVDEARKRAEEARARVEATKKLLAESEAKTRGTSRRRRRR